LQEEKKDAKEESKPDLPLVLCDCYRPNRDGRRYWRRDVPDLISSLWNAEAAERHGGTGVPDFGWRRGDLH